MQWITSRSRAPISLATPASSVQNGMSGGMMSEATRGCQTAGAFGIHGRAWTCPRMWSTSGTSCGCTRSARRCIAFLPALMPSLCIQLPVSSCGLEVAHLSQRGDHCPVFPDGLEVGHLSQRGGRVHVRSRPGAASDSICKTRRPRPKSGSAERNRHCPTRRRRCGLASLVAP